MFTPEQRGTGGTEAEEEEEDIDEEKMGVGKNTTAKSMDSSSEGGKYEEEAKHGADFYPIPVNKLNLMKDFMVTELIRLYIHPSTHLYIHLPVHPPVHSSIHHKFIKLFIPPTVKITDI